MQAEGVIIKGVGGLYSVRVSDGTVYVCRARGVFRHEHISPTVGDRALISYGEKLDGEDGRELAKAAKHGVNIDGVIDEICGRRNLLIRPPMANLDVIFAIIPTCRPEPDLFSADKLLSIAEHADIEPAVIITKYELDPEAADKVADIYRRAGYGVFPVSSATGFGTDALLEYIDSLGRGAITAFAGASGAGKSTLLNRLYPTLTLKTGELSHKIERGKQTTRHVELYDTGTVFIADTPGFSLLDFERFDFFGVEALPFTFREFDDYHGKCRYTKCTHLCEDGCAVIRAVDEGIIPRERHESYKKLYAVLKNKHAWQ